MRARLTYPNVISTLALIAVIAGGTAAALPGKNSVQSNDLRKNAVKARAIASNAVRGGEVKDGAVGGAEVADRSLGYADVGSGSSVIARIRSTESVSTGDATPSNRKPLAVTANTWMQAPGEMDIFFGEVTFTKSGPCANGSAGVLVLIDGQLAADGFGQGYNELNPGTYTQEFLRERPWLSAPASATPRTATVEVFDTCDGAGSITIESVKVNVVAVR